jgi:hypothetical protein
LPEKLGVAVGKNKLIRHGATPQGERARTPAKAGKSKIAEPDFLFLAAFGRRHQGKVEIAGLKRIFILAQGRVVGRHRHGEVSRQ